MTNNKINRICGTLVSCIFCMSFSAEMFAWGWEHRGIAYMAQQHLTETTAAMMEHYLDRSFIDSACWLDDVRREKIPEYMHTRWWHMLAVDADGKVSDEPLRSTGDGAALGRLKEAAAVLKDYRSLTDSAVCVNIKYVLHVLVDMHAPSHIFYSDLPGGMDAKPRHYNFFPVTYKGQTVTYHSMWDSPLKRLHPDWDEARLCEELDVPDPAAIEEMTRGTFDEWAQDNADSCRIIYEWAKPGDVLDDSFYAEHEALAVAQYRKAAYRLAYLLNCLFDNDYKYNFAN